jgi:RHS repeat-associated protein
VGNRTTGGSVVNAGNQLTADANFAYIYDDNGNLTRKTLLATGNYTQYTYDVENRLTKVEDFVAGNPTPAFTSTYRYDGLGRRIEKVANGQTKRYIYDGEDILLEYDGANVLQARYTHGPGIDEPIAVTKGASTFFYHQDGLGTVTDLTDSTGATAKSYAYDAYGNILESPGTLDQPYTYTGRELDSESGLYYYRSRFYDPLTARFLRPDPIGFSGGINFYAYVANNPVRFNDPYGLKSRACCKKIPVIGLLGFRHCYIETQIDGKRKSTGLIGGIFSGQPYGTGNIYYNNDFDKGGSCGDWNEGCGTDGCVKKQAEGYPNPSEYDLLGPNSNTFAGTVARACDLKRPDLYSATTPGWDDKPAPQKPDHPYKPPTNLGVQ